MSLNLKNMSTETRNQNTMNLDIMSPLEVVTVMNQEDAKVPAAITPALPNIAQCVTWAIESIEAGGRIIYMGAGTSGRLGVLDAVECPPTFGVAPEVVVGLIAGGEKAFVKAVEGAEDSRELGRQDLIGLDLKKHDLVIGIAASGRTPYVLGAMDYARSLGAPVMALTCCSNSELSRHADITMAPVPGPEVVTGSSRLKSGTAQKLVLNMLSTATMIKLGKVYGNLMVDVKATNEKLVHRAISIVCTATGVDNEMARATLEKCEFRCKTAIVMILLGLDADAANAALDAAKGHISAALKK